MTPEELQDYHHLKKILSVTSQCEEWDSDVDYDKIISACMLEQRSLQVRIGQRIYLEHEKESYVTD
jgi:hypothetical protein